MLSDMHVPCTVVHGTICWIHTSYSGSHQTLGARLREGDEIGKSECLLQQKKYRTSYDFSLCSFPLMGCKRTFVRMWSPQQHEITTKEGILGVTAEFV